MCPSPKSVYSREWGQAVIGNFSFCPHVSRAQIRSTAGYIPGHKVAEREDDLSRLYHLHLVNEVSTA
jgi:hypothetical protein